MRGSRREGGEHPDGRQPRLVLRFAAASLVLFVAIGIGLSQYIAHAFVGREEQAARVHAQFVSDSILRYELTPAELAFLTPMDGDNKNEMYRFVASRVLKWPIVRVKIWRRDGIVIFSDATELIGSACPWTRSFARRSPTPR